jgi:FkbM family methyltransferase
MIKISMQELLSTRICEAHFDPEWRNAHHPSVGQDVFVADVPGMVVHLRCPPEATGIWLLRHGWSGSVELTCAGATTAIILQHDSEDAAFVAPLPAIVDGEMEVILRSARAPGAADAPSEVWLFGLAFSSLPMPRAKSATISNSTRLVSGNWGKFLVLNTDTVLPTAILNEGAWAPKDVAIFQKYVKPGDVAVDVGANFGHHAVVFSKLVGEEGLVLAVEAQMTMFQLLCANCIINGAANVVPLRLAASDHSHSITLYPIDYAGEHNFGSLGVNPDPAKFSGGRVGEAVEARCLDDLVEEHCAGRRVSFIKIDVQSYEKFVLIGLLRTIVKHRPVVFLEVSPVWMQRAGYSFREIYRVLGQLDYQFEHSRALDFGADGIPEVAADADFEWDVLAIPKTMVNDAS